MKIVMITDTYPPNVNGAALATERLATELAKLDHEVFVIAPSTSFTSFKTQQKNVMIYRVRSIPILLERTQEFRVSPQPLHDKEIRKIIHEIKPDIIHINEPWLLGITAIKIGKKEHIPVVATHHFMPENLVHYLHLPQKIENLIHKTIWQWYAKFCRNFSVVICPSQTAADLINKYTTGVNLAVISNGIDLTVFNTKNIGTYLLQKYKLPEKPRILFVGRLDKEKNIDILLKASALLKDRFDFHLVIVGQGKERMALKKLATKLGISDRVTFTGLLPNKDLPNIYKIADIFVMPSIAELQSLVTMEAMASGLPVIAADAVALPHLVKDSKNGFLFSPGDERRLADKLEILLRDKNLQKKMGRESLEIINHHDIRKTVREVEKVYTEAILSFPRMRESR